MDGAARTEPPGLLGIGGAEQLDWAAQLAAAEQLDGVIGGGREKGACK